MMEIPVAMKKQYVARREKDAEECELAVTNKDLGVLKRIGHQLKGNAVTYGFPELGEAGAQLEEAAKKENWDQISLYAAQLKKIISELPKFPNE